MAASFVNRQRPTHFISQGGAGPWRGTGRGVRLNAFGPLPTEAMTKIILSGVLLSICAARSNAAPQTPAVPSRPPLQAIAFLPLPLTSVKPTGWLLDQLRIQAGGLSGHLDEFWPDLGSNSGWLGGTGESWERGPYFLDGLVPLAYLTGDIRLIAKVKRWMDWTLDHQQPDSWIGPTKTDPQHPQDWWPNYVMLKALAQYQEATGDPRVIPVMERYFAYQAQHLSERPLKQWAIFRWHDEVLTILWLYNRNGDETLLDLARKLHAQGHDWEAQFADFKFHEKVGRSDANLATHGVNNAMAMKAAAVWWSITGEKGDRDALYRMFEALDRYHGQPSGIFGADEHYAGRDPSQGTELCAVVEAMFSLEVDMSILGDPAFGDRLEKIAYNALPGTFTSDMWAHQYDQQANQISCTLANRRWTTNGPQSNIFGLEPNFGCCTANMHQGWPKLAANLWMATPDAGLVAIAYGPSIVTTTVAGGVPVIVEEQTEYPFRETIGLTVRPAHPARFPLVLRIPAWALKASVAVNGQAQSGVESGKFFTVDRGELEQAQVDRPFDGLGDLPYQPVELRAGFGSGRSGKVDRSEGAPHRETAVQLRRHAGGAAAEGAPAARMANRRRFRGSGATKSGDEQGTRTDRDPDTVRRSEVAHYRVSDCDRRERSALKTLSFRSVTHCQRHHDATSRKQGQKVTRRRGEKYGRRCRCGWRYLRNVVVVSQIVDAQPDPTPPEE